MTGSTSHELKKSVKKSVRMCPVGYTSNKSPHADLDTLSTLSIGLFHDRMAQARWVRAPLLKAGHGPTRALDFTIYSTSIFLVETFHFYQDRTLENVVQFSKIWVIAATRSSTLSLSCLCPTSTGSSSSELTPSI